MISRFYLENYLSFNKVDLKFDKGLIVFTGPSGSGKSILMAAILALFGNTDSKASLSEVTIEELNIKDENFAIEPNDDIIIKQITQNKTRYLINNQTISKKNLKEFSSKFSSYLHLKDTSDFDSAKIISFLDYLSSKNDKSYKKLLDNYKDIYNQYIESNKKLQKLLSDEKELDDLIEFAKFEIDKISRIDPKVDEYDELKLIKTNLSKKDKIKKILDESYLFLNNSHKISSALQYLDQDSNFFDDAINEVQNIFEKFNDSIASMEDMDIEGVLDRIEQLSFLIKKYGGIEEALEYKKAKQIELDGYENISFEKAILEKNVKKYLEQSEELAKELSSKRAATLKIFTKKINSYLKYLYLENLSISLELKTIDSTGIDSISFKLNDIELNKISSGEFNRLRLALLTARSSYELNTNGILFLDEIDANLSGKESESIAKVLSELSKHYQIFAISHQPQLSATASQHFLVTKKNNISKVELLHETEKVKEIARMISGQDITQEALEFSKKLVFKK